MRQLHGLFLYFLRGRHVGGFTLLEMMIVLSLTAIALIPLFKWQTFVLGCLRTQRDYAQMLQDTRRVLRQFERDLTCAHHIILADKPVADLASKPDEIPSSHLVLYLPEPKDPFDPSLPPIRVEYGMGDGSHFDHQATNLMRVCYTADGKIFGTTTTLAEAVGKFQVSKINDKLFRLELGILTGKDEMETFCSAATQFQNRNNQAMISGGNQ